MLTSAGPAEGKSTTTANLAVTYAQAGKRVLVIDADLRKPTLHHTFGLTNRWGLTSVMVGQAPLEQAIQDTNVENLWCLTSGPLPPNPSEMLASNKMTALIENLKKEFDIILFDTPPVIAVTDAQIVASKCDGVVLVIDYGNVKKEIALKAKQLLEMAHANLLGVVINNKKHTKHKEYYYYYYYS
jgi:capsular exopolysaccharide synthesis family protein